MTQYQSQRFFEVDVSFSRISLGLGIRLGRDNMFLCTSSHIYLHVLYTLVKRHSSFICKHKHTIGDTHFSLEMVSFITVLEIAFSCLADKCVDLDRYGIVRGRVANKCEGRPLSLPLYLFCCGVAFCQGEKPRCLPDRSVSPSQRLMWLQGLSMGKETRALSEDPVLHLLSPLSWSLCWKPVSSGVCQRKPASVSVPLSTPLVHTTSITV